MVGSRSDSLPLKPPPNQLRSPLNWRWNNRRPTLLRHLISSEQNIAHLQARYNSIANLRSVHLLFQNPRVAYPPLRDSHSPRATFLPRPLDTTTSPAPTTHSIPQDSPLGKKVGLLFLLFRRECIRHLCYRVSNTASHGSQPPPTVPPSPRRDALSPLRKTTTIGDILFDHRYSSVPKLPPYPRFTIYPSRPDPDPAVTRGRPLANPHTTTNMDGKRHPSSFQQLEKLGEGTYATVTTPRAPPPLTACQSLIPPPHTGLQGPQPRDGRACRPQGDPSRFRRRHP